MSGWQPPYDDLVISRLLAEAAASPAQPADVSEVAALIADAPPPRFPNSVLGILRQADTGAVESLIDVGEQYRELLSPDLAGLVSMHLEPAREITLDDGATSVLLQPFSIGEDLVVVSATWSVERLENFAPVKGALREVDEFHTVQHLNRLERTMAAWARETQFVPEYPTLRAVCVIAGSLMDAFDGFEEQLRAAAAVRGVELDYLVASHDPLDTRAHLRFERTVLSNRYRLLLTVSEPNARWVWRLAAKFKDTNRTHRALPPTSADDALTVFASDIAVITEAFPKRPTEYWGPDAVERGQARESAAFALSDRARKHLAANRYPAPERMLEHLELLAGVAEAWRHHKESGEGPTGRLVDWVKTEFGLEIALHDKGINEKDAYFDFEGQRLCNRPHVKVDDHTSATWCGRIYFALDERPADGVWRFVVDHIGLHDRS